MAWIEANNGTQTAYEEGTRYTATIKEITFEPDGKFGAQFKFVFDVDGSDEWVWASTKLGKHQGRVSKLRGICNAVFMKPEGTEIKAINDETFEVKYDGEAKPRKLGAGMILRMKGEYFEGDDGTTSWKWTRFAGVENSAVENPQPALV